MAKPSYTGNDARDRDTFLRRVYAFGAVRSAVMNLEKEDRLAGRAPERGDKWLREKDFERQAYGAAAGASLRQSLRSSLRQEGGALSEGRARKALAQLREDIQEPWRGMILQEFEAVLGGHDDADPVDGRDTVSRGGGERGGVKTGVERAHVSAIWQMRPGHRWYITMDETGSVFGGPKASADPMTNGRMVAIATNEHTQIEKLSPSFHACDVGYTKVVAGMQALAKSGAGALGIAATDKGTAESREGWQYLVVKLLNWALIMLPLPDDGPGNEHDVDIHIDIEERSQFTQGMNVDLTRHQLLQLLERRYPDRAGKIRMQLAIVSKPRGRSLQPYADVLAYSWMTWARQGHTDSAAAVARALVKSGATKGILFTSDELSRGGDTFSSIIGGRFANEQHFQETLSSVLDFGPASPSAFLLQRAAETARHNDDARDELHSWVTNHINDASVDLKTARRELDWFRAAGLAEELTPAERLIFATAQLDYANLAGEDESDEEFVVTDLAERLADTHPILCIQARLVHLSFLSNRRAFADGLQRALELVALADERHYSLLWRARAASVAGQFHAFNNEWGKSGRSFEQARAHIARYVALEPAGQPDELKIATLHALAVWDTPDQSPETARTHLADLLALADVTIADLVAGDSVKLVYVHHACLRYAALFPDAEVADEVLTHSTKWKTGGEQHPWPFIRLYREMILLNRGRASQQQREPAYRNTAASERDVAAREAITKCLQASNGKTGLSEVRAILKELVPYSMH
jgi:hypothetical protein